MQWILKYYSLKYFVFYIIFNFACNALFVDGDVLWNTVLGVAASCITVTAYVVFRILLQTVLNRLRG